MKKKGLWLSLCALFLVACSSNQTSSQSTTTTAVCAETQNNSNILVINASRNVDGNTAQMGLALLDGMDYTQLNLVEYHINQLGQTREGDQYEEVLTAMEQAQTIVIGTPVYWHSMSGDLKTLIDRFYELQGSGHDFSGKNLYFFMQGSAPTDLAIESTEYIIQRVAAQTHMNLRGMADNNSEITELHNQLLAEQ